MPSQVLRSALGKGAFCCRNGQGMSVVRGKNVEFRGNRKYTCREAGMCKGAREAEKEPRGGPEWQAMKGSVNILWGPYSGCSQDFGFHSEWNRKHLKRAFEQRRDII